MSGDLTKLERNILWVIIKLDGYAYGVTIRKELANSYGSDVSYWAIYSALNSLENKGLVTFQSGDATKERGFREKRYYMITGE